MAEIRDKLHNVGHGTKAAAR